jgi:glutathione reductase (NADPH)
MTETFDLIVVGTGSAATAAAYPCAAAGWRVAIVDSRPFGGTCALRGCDPKKVLVGAADLVDWTRRMSGKGVEAPGASIDWRALMAFKRTFTAPVPAAREKAFADSGLTSFHGRARFQGPRTVQIGGQMLQAAHYVIACGAAPARLHISGEDLLVTSDGFLELDKLPPRIIFVGGGYIAFEFAHIAARAGAKVTILDRGHRPLELFDADLTARLVEHTRALGIDVLLETAVEAVEEAPGSAGFRVHAGRQTFSADLVVHSAGRLPEIEDLDLPAAGVEFERGGVKVNEFLQSVSNPAVYAAGDCAASGPPLTPVAGYEGGIVAHNLLDGNRHRPDYTGVASVVFTIPPMATVGLQEEAARRQGLRFNMHQADTGGWYSSRRVAEECAAFKVLVEEGTERILGAHLLGPDAGEVINLFALAIRAGLKASQVREALYAYPTQGSDVKYMV